MVLSHCSIPICEALRVCDKGLNLNPLFKDEHPKLKHIKLAKLAYIANIHSPNLCLHNKQYI